MKINLLVLINVICCSLSVYAQGDLELFIGYSRQRIETERFKEFERYAGLTPAQVQTNFGATQAQLDEGFKDTYRAARNLNGVNASATYYFNGGFGITGDFAYHFADEVRQTPSNPIFFEDFTRSRRRSLTFVGGPQYKFNKTSKIQSFVRALFGITRQKNRSSQFFNSVGGTNPGGTNQPIETTRLEDNFTALTAGFGGGIDVKISTHLAIRVIQVDYLATFARSRDASLISPTIGGNGGVSLGQTSFNNSRRDNFRFSFGIVFQK
ncbi:MAG: hypothetical protein WA584_02030 [Pyrinomonadaceae bacterium]